MPAKGYIQNSIGQMVAAGLYRQAKAIQDKTSSPGGQGFKLKLHEDDPEAPLSPVYVNLRNLQSVTQLLRTTAELYLKMIEPCKFDLIAGIPEAGIPLATVISQLSGVPMITPRKGEKTHGSGAKIDGLFQPGQTAIMIDDLITKSKSKKDAIGVLEAAGLIVTDVAVLVDREQGGSQELADAGYTLHAAFTLRELLDFYLEQGMMAQALYDEIITYLGQ
ncbi:MAG: hypothetical protein WC508_00630 [Patescibacteria group bacterium]